MRRTPGEGTPHRALRLALAMSVGDGGSPHGHSWLQRFVDRPSPVVESGRLALICGTKSSDPLARMNCCLSVT